MQVTMHFKSKTSVRHSDVSNIEQSEEGCLLVIDDQQLREHYHEDEYQTFEVQEE